MAGFFRKKFKHKLILVKEVTVDSEINPDSGTYRNTASSTTPPPSESYEITRRDELKSKSKRSSASPRLNATKLHKSQSWSSGISVGSNSACSDSEFSMIEGEDLEKELDAIQSNWPAHRPSIKEVVRRRSTKKKTEKPTITIKENPEPIIVERGSEESDDQEDNRPTEFKYIDENVVGRETFLHGPYGERQGKCIGYKLTFRVFLQLCKPL